MDAVMSNTKAEIEAELIASLETVKAAATAEEEAEAVARGLAEIEAKQSVVDMSDVLAELNDFKPGSSLSDDEVPEELLNELETQLAREEVYTAQVSETTISTAPVAPVASKKTPRVAKTPRTPSSGTSTKTPRVDVATLDDSVFEIIIGAPVDKAAVLAKKPLQKKIGEKFDNIFLSISAGTAPSRYIEIAFRKLEALGTMTSADLIAAMLASPSSGPNDTLGKGTAHSQAGQIMTLFSVLGIADRSGHALTLRPDSAIAAKLRAIFAQTATPA